MAAGKNLELALRIRADMQEAVTEVGKLDKALDGLQSSGQAAGKGLGQMAAAGQASARAQVTAASAARESAHDLQREAQAAKDAARQHDALGKAARRSSQRPPPIPAQRLPGGLTEKQYAMAMRQLPMQLTDIGVGLASGQSPFMVMIQQGGQLKDAFGGIVPAAKAVAGAISGTTLAVTAGAAAFAAIGAAAYSAYSDLQNFERTLIATGNVAGTTAGAMAQIADRVGEASGQYGEATEAVNALAASGKFAGETLEIATAAAVNLAKLTEMEVSAAAEQLAKMAEAPSQGLLELNRKYHFLTGEVYDHVRALEDQGRTQEAVQAAVEAFARVHETRVREAYERAGWLEKAWIQVKNAVGGAINDLKNLFDWSNRGLEQIARNMDRYRGYVTAHPILGAGAWLSRPLLKPFEERAAAHWAEKAAAEEAAKAEESRQQAVEDAYVEASNKISQQIRATDKLAERTHRLAELEKQRAAIAAKNPNDARLTDGTFDRLRQHIIDSTTERTPKGRTSAPKKTESQQAEEAAQREIVNLQKQIALQATLVDGQERITTLARTNVEIEQGQFRLASAAAQEELRKQAQLLDAAELRREADRDLLSARQQLARLTGDDAAQVRETVTALEKQRDVLQQMGREADAADVGRLIDLTRARHELQQLQDAHARALDEMQRESERIGALVSAGVMTEIDAQQHIVDLYRRKAEVLRGLVPQMRQVAEAFRGTAIFDDIISEIDRLDIKIGELANTTNLLQKAVREAFQGTFKQLLMDIGDLSTSITEDLLNFVGGIAQQLAAFAAEQLSQRATNWLMDTLGKKFPGLLGGEQPEDKTASALVAAGDTAATALTQAGQQAAAAIRQAVNTPVPVSGAPVPAIAPATPVVDTAGAQAAAEAMQSAGSSISGGAAAVGNAAVQLASAAGGLSPGASAVVNAAVQLLQAAQMLMAANAAKGAAGVAAATGGYIRGPGTGTSDSIPAWLSNGEFVTRARVVGQPGALAFLRDFNRRGMAALRQWQAFADGGLVTAQAAPAPRLAQFAQPGLQTRDGRPVALRINNVVSPSLVGDYLDTPHGEISLMNVIERNAQGIRRMIGG